jgi:glutathione S-transferase
MALKLYAHPFSSYCQKVLIALYENSTPFEYLTLDDAKNGAALEALWPIKKFPVLVDEGRAILEASIIIEHLDLHHPGPVRLIPEDQRGALEVRLMDRFFDNYIMTPMQKIVTDRIRSEQDRDPYGVSEARPCSTRLTAGSKQPSPRGNGPPAPPSALPIAPLPHPFLCRLGAPDGRKAFACSGLPPETYLTAFLRTGGR